LKAAVSSSLFAAADMSRYLSIEADPRTDRVIVMSVIDNMIKMIKGQAGQAIQCVNLMMGWDETLGLPKLAFYP
jgi:N-acetyl-gamma-glutamyl-phosphate reductase